MPPSGVTEAYVPDTPGAVRDALAEGGLAPLHRLGQHFLVDRRLCERIAQATQAWDATTCLEIGPGLGALTAALMRTGRRVVAIELDRGLVAFLRARAEAGDELLTVVEGDARDADLAGLSPPERTVLVGNLPYYASAPLLRRAVEIPYPGAVVMLQREVAERLEAPAGGADRGALSVLREATCDIERLFAVPQGAFYPRPEVASTVVRLSRRPDALSGARYLALAALVGQGFRYRRKGMRQALRHGTGLGAQAVEELLAQACVAPGRRPETLTLEEWLALLDARQSQGGEARCLPAAPGGS